MCGICGIANTDAGQPVSPSLVRAMCAAITHRGPDEDGFLFEDSIGLGMRRLSIIDLGGGSQPIANESATAEVVFNGEIYNHAAIRRQLVERGHRFRTRSDTEAVVHAYDEWGVDCPQHLDGMFAFAIWDRHRQRLFIARDRLGEKPLYYYRDDRCFVFGSEIKSILIALGGRAELSLPALDSYLSLGYVPGPDTMFAAIKKLPAAHSLTWEAGRLTIRPYWRLRYTAAAPLDGTAARDRLRELLLESVQTRLMSDVPLGAFLSGGLDSSLLVGLMSRAMNRPVQTFSVGFAEKDLNELDYARTTATAFATDHHELYVDHCDPDLVDRIAWHLDEPVSDPATVPTYLVSGLARQHVKVVLTGEGADELFAGYSYYEASRSSLLERLLPPGAASWVLPTLGRTANRVLGRPRYHPRTLWNWSLPPERRMVAWVAVFTDEDKQRLCTPDFLRRQAGRCAYQAFEDWYRDCDDTDVMHRMMYVDTGVWLPDDLLMKVDKMSMAHSLEARAPYLTPALVEFAAQLPADVKRRGPVGKLILRDIAAEVLPSQIIDRPKHTFDVPIGRWLNSSLRDLTQDLFAASRLSACLDTNFVRTGLCRAVAAGEPGAARQLWSLLLLELWVRRHDAAIA